MINEFGHLTNEMAPSHNRKTTDGDDELISRKLLFNSTFFFFLSADTRNNKLERITFNRSKIKIRLIKNGARWQNSDRP